MAARILYFGRGSRRNPAAPRHRSRRSKTSSPPTTSRSSADAAQAAAAPAAVLLLIVNHARGPTVALHAAHLAPRRPRRADQLSRRALRGGRLRSRSHGAARGRGGGGARPGARRDPRARCREYHTSTGFSVTPVVGWAEPPLHMPPRSRARWRRSSRCRSTSSSTRATTATRAPSTAGACGTTGPCPSAAGSSGGPPPGCWSPSSGLSPARAEKGLDKDTNDRSILRPMNAAALVRHSTTKGEETRAQILDAAVQHGERGRVRVAHHRLARGEDGPVEERPVRALRLQARAADRHARRGRAPLHRGGVPAGPEGAARAEAPARALRGLDRLAASAPTCQAAARIDCGHARSTTTSRARCAMP